MKILHVIKTVAVGGAELHVLRISRQLVARGHQVRVACLREHVPDTPSLRPEFEAAGVRVIDLSRTAGGLQRGPSTIVPLLRTFGPDLVHSHLPRADLAAAIGVWRIPTPWVVTIHGNYQEQWRGRALLPIYDRLWRRADAVLCVSEAVRDWVVRGRGIPAARTRVVANGVEPEIYATPRRNVRDALGLNREPVVGTLGRLERSKGHDVLIRSLSILRQQVPDARLLIAGPDPWGYGAHLRTLTDQLGLREYVKFVGFQSDVPSFLHALDVFAFPSRSEGFGQVVIETMAAGRPVVAVDAAPFREIVTHGRTGLLVRPEDPARLADGLRDVLRDPIGAGEMARAGQQAVRERFTAAMMTDGVERVYSEVVSP
jgi:glycosyltransferase involved in cell wall biosynthesis